MPFLHTHTGMIKGRMSDKPGWKALQVGLEKLKTGMKPRRNGEMSEGKSPKPSSFGGKLRRACEAFGSRLLFGKCMCSFSRQVCVVIWFGMFV